MVEKAGRALQEIAISIETPPLRRGSPINPRASSATRKPEGDNRDRQHRGRDGTSSEEASATVQEQTASMQEMAAAAELAAMAEKLNQLVRGFR